MSIRTRGGASARGDPPRGLDAVHRRASARPSPRRRARAARTAGRRRPRRSPRPPPRCRRLGVEDHAEARPHQRLVVGDQHPDRSSVTTAVQREPGADRKPPPGRGPAVERAAEQRDPLAHADQTVAARRRPGRRPARDRRRPPRSRSRRPRSARDAGVRAAGVLQHVRQRLLDDAVRRQVDPGGQRPRRPSVDDSTGEPGARGRVSSNSSRCGEARLRRPARLRSSSAFRIPSSRRISAMPSGRWPRSGEGLRGFTGIPLDHAPGGTRLTTITLMRARPRRAARVRCEPVPGRRRRGPSVPDPHAGAADG